MMQIPEGISVPFFDNPRLVIVRQPKKRGYRFRYKSEGETHGGIPGESDIFGSKKCYPTIRIDGYSGPAKIVVTLVEAKEPFHLHAHSMIVNREPQKGFCIFEMNGCSNTLELKNIAIQHAVKEKLTPTLMDRILQNRFVESFGWNSALNMTKDAAYDVEYYTSILEDQSDEKGFIDRTTAKAVAGVELKQLEEDAKKLAKTMSMNSCRLRFQAFLPENGKYTRVLDDVLSDEIIDGKTKEGATLRIIRLSSVSSSVKGQEEIWLLADKLNADDVEVRFFKKDEKGGIAWEGFGEFSKADVFKQAVLIFRTPQYYDIEVKQPVKVYLQLRRKKDISCTSDPTQFTYKPVQFDQYKIAEKRKKPLPKSIIDGSLKKSQLNISDLTFGASGASSTSVGNPDVSISVNKNIIGINQYSNNLMQRNDLSNPTFRMENRSITNSIHQNNTPFQSITGMSSNTGQYQQQRPPNNLVATTSIPRNSTPSVANVGGMNMEINDYDSQLTDSFMKDILDIKEETLSPPPNNPTNGLQMPELATPSFTAFLQNFSADENSMSQDSSTMWN